MNVTQTWSMLVPHIIKSNFWVNWITVALHWSLESINNYRLLTIKYWNKLFVPWKPKVKLKEYCHWGYGALQTQGINEILPNLSIASWKTRRVPIKNIYKWEKINFMIFARQWAEWLYFWKTFTMNSSKMEF